MGMTAIEKILARNGDLKEVRPGDVVTVRVETSILFDNNLMDSVWREILEVHDPSKVVVVIDHRAPAAHVLSAKGHKRGREFVRKFGITRFHDIGREQGISHVLVADHGYGLPGTVLLCSDSHTCSAGVFNVAARGVGSPDITYSICKGETWFRVGETVRYDLEGALPPGVFTKDVFLHMAGHYGNHATMNIEFGGPALPGLSMNARRTLTTMGAELSVEFATFEPDDIMLDYVRARTDKPFEPQWPDADAKYLDRRTIEPQRHGAAGSLAGHRPEQLAQGGRGGGHGDRPGLHRFLRQRHARRLRGRCADPRRPPRQPEYAADRDAGFPEHLPRGDAPRLRADDRRGWRRGHQRDLRRLRRR